MRDGRNQSAGEVGREDRTLSGAPVFANRRAGYGKSARRCRHKGTGGIGATYAGGAAQIVDEGVGQVPVLDYGNDLSVDHLLPASEQEQAVRPQDGHFMSRAGVHSQGVQEQSGP